jgi:hypothetical protein
MAAQATAAALAWPAMEKWFRSSLRVFAPVDDAPERAAVVGALADLVARGFERSLVGVDCSLEPGDLLPHHLAGRSGEVARPGSAEGGPLLAGERLSSGRDAPELADDELA